MHLIMNSSDVALSFLLAFSVKATVVLALAWMLTLALRHQSAALRHGVWTAAILSSLLLPILTLVLPTWRSPNLGNAVARLSAPRPILSALHPSTLGAMSVDALASASPFNHLRFWVLLVWAVGMCLFVLKLSVGIARLVSTRARGNPLLGDDWRRYVLELSRRFELRRPVRLLATADSRPMPVTWGILRPCILLPTDAIDWSQERKRIVVSHELAHIRRGDWFWQICAELLRTVYWFHPLAWVAARKLRHESERACDDCVLNSGIPATDYASQLLDLARTLGNSRRRWATALAVARPSSLERRLLAMLNPSINRHRLSQRARLMIPLAAICLLIPLAALRLPAQNLSGTFAGTVYDASGTGVRNATVIMTTPKTFALGGKQYATNEIEMTTTDAEGKFSFKSLPAGEYEVKILKSGFEEYRQPQVLLEAGRDNSLNATLKLGSVMEEVYVVPEGAAKPSPESQNGGPVRLRLGGDVEAAKRVRKVQPVYPATAKEAGVQGTVILHAIIGLDGRPLSLRVMNKDVDPDLARASVEAVSQWRYQPTLLNGQPVEVDSTIQVVFTLQP